MFEASISDPGYMLTEITGRSVVKSTVWLCTPKIDVPTATLLP